LAKPTIYTIRARKQAREKSVSAYFYSKTGEKLKQRQRRVVITGIGAVTPLGNDIQTTWENLIDGNSGIGPITLFNASKYPVKIAAEVKNFNFEKTILSEDLDRFFGRSTRFCVNAVQEALLSANLNITNSLAEHIGIALGSNEEYAHLSQFNRMFDNEKILEILQARKAAKLSGSAASQNYAHLASSKMLGQIWPLRRSAHLAASLISILHNIKGPISTTSSACASSGLAIGRALRMIQDGDADIAITGGCDAIIGETSVTGFSLLGALSKQHNAEPEKASRPFDLKRDGFILGEGSGILILEELSHARKRNAPILAELAGYGSSSNAYRLTASPEDGSGADVCMSRALQDAGCSFEDIDYINAHGTSTYINDKCETAAIKKVFTERAYEIPVSSNKSMLGHLVASAASIELIISVLTINGGIIPATINYENPDPECDLDYVPNEPRKKQVETILSNSFAFGGQNASLVVKKYS
jgi:3-oxoacyl-[acyl-carrier-protein] synthase II